MTIPMDLHFDAATKSETLAPMDAIAAAEWDAAANPPIEEAKARKLAALAARRWQAEQSGTVAGGLPVATDDTSQTKVLGAVVAAQLDPGYVVNWKTAAGFVSLDATQVLAVAQAIRSHIQACFDHEASLTDDIAAAADASELAAVDIEAGWPSE